VVSLPPNTVQLREPATEPPFCGSIWVSITHGEPDMTAVLRLFFDLVLALVAPRVVLVAENVLLRIKRCNGARCRRSGRT
jgi:hypothetical protein